ncbi:MAG: DUF790 family protein [Planctomycetota bacterium]|nr:DUF790 family protein [Planctomycetota bacterium]
MLTADLLRSTVRDGQVRPFYVNEADPELLELARVLLRIFEFHHGKSRRALQAELDGFLGSGTAFLLHRGLAKLLFDRCELRTEAAVDPAELRRAVFERAARMHTAPGARGFDRTAVLRDVRSLFEIDSEEIERNFYADLREEQVLESLETISPRRLLERYNVALAQAVLLRATGLEIDINHQTPQRYRELFRSIKFFQLLHSVTGDAEQGYRIRLDGPFSLFRSSQRYGLQMASFLPTLLSFDDWSLEASVLWGKARVQRRFHLSSADGLPPTRDLKGQWQPAELEWLPRQFAKLDSEWRISRETELVNLGGCGVLVPDHVFVHEPTGKRVSLEIFGYWRRGALRSRLELLREHGPEELILALSRDLHVEEEEIEDLPGEVYTFRTHPIARELLALLDRFVGRTEPGGPAAGRSH